jgi:hypothetical protein
VGQTFEATLLTPSKIPPSRYGWIYRLLVRLLENRKQYEVTINDYSTCNCVDFSSMMVLSLDKQRPWMPCKHLYYILQYAMYFRIKEPFIHYPSWSWNEFQFFIKRMVIEMLLNDDIYIYIFSNDL